MMKKIFIILTLLILVSFFDSCNDIQSLEPNISKELIYRPPTVEDSLSQLAYESMELGNVKMGSQTTEYIIMMNMSITMPVTIYSVESTNPTGLFTYSYPTGLPFTIQPKENTYLTQRIYVKFVAAVYNLGFYYDTLMFNHNKRFYLPIAVKVIY